MTILLTSAERFEAQRALDAEKEEFVCGVEALFNKFFPGVQFIDCELGTQIKEEDRQ